VAKAIVWVLLDSGELEASQTEGVGVETGCHESSPLVIEKWNNVVQEWLEREWDKTYYTVRKSSKSNERDVESSERRRYSSASARAPS
jgi:hypothetical protein